MLFELLTFRTPSTNNAIIAKLIICFLGKSKILIRQCVKHKVGRAVVIIIKTYSVDKIIFAMRF